MADPNVYIIDHIFDVDGGRVTVGVDYNTVTIDARGARLDQGGMAELGRAIQIATFRAGQNEGPTP
jgi:hypothetical protein